MQQTWSSVSEWRLAAGTVASRPEAAVPVRPTERHAVRARRPLSGSAVRGVAASAVRRRRPCHVVPEQEARRVYAVPTRELRQIAEATMMSNLVPEPQMPEKTSAGVISQQTYRHFAKDRRILANWM